MNRYELRAGIVMSLVMMLRMFGLFLILPVFSIYARKDPSASPMLIGLALGGYGITQAILQIPMGKLSDWIGRKPVIIGGLLCFALGSFIATSVQTIYGAIIGRIIQGTGAISPAVMSLLADMTREEVRTKVMSLVGMSIGFSFLLALLIAPLIVEHINMSGIFMVSGLAALIAILVLMWLPEKTESFNTEPTKETEEPISPNSKQKLRSNYIGVGCLHAVLTMNFIVVPITLADRLNLATKTHAMIYLLAMLISIPPFILIVWRSRQKNNWHISSMVIAFLLITELLLPWFGTTKISIILLLGCFFIGFNFLEASMPANVSRESKKKNRGTIMGIYATWQFMGAFLGGVLGGILLHQFGNTSVFYGSAVLIIFWLIAHLKTRRCYL